MNDQENKIIHGMRSGKSYGKLLELAMEFYYRTGIYIDPAYIQNLNNRQNMKKFSDEEIEKISFAAREKVMDPEPMLTGKAARRERRKKDRKNSKFKFKR